MNIFRLDPGKISSRQAMFIIIVVILSTADVFLPTVVAMEAGRDAWIAVIIATALALAVALIALALGLRFPNQTLVQIFHTVFGKYAGWILAFVFVLMHPVFLTAITVGQIGVILKVAFMGKTPLLVFNGIIVLAAAYAVYHGLETIARVVEILFPIGIFTLAMVGLLVLTKVDFGNYLPILENGFGPPLLGAFRLLSFLLEGIVLLMLIPYVNQPKKLIVALVWVMVLLGVSLLIGVLAIGMFGARYTAVTTFAALSMVRQIKIGGFLDHLDAVIMTIWISGIYLKLAVLYYIACIGVAQLTRCNNYRVLIVPLGILVTVSSVTWFENIPQVFAYIREVWPGQSLLFGFVLPLVVLVVAAARGLKES
ncbi:GerAB/ArcD/ProY family transporter [Desulfofalx alkaliphila]|uniref:GerAB/ArcD/ProY family transporter n=1 Tax=Desulfofalx alkaliphila TaxID=105483 RepID=UPI0004E28580|nr:endospore germination permease [Desulfofalx alkaliphila]